MAVDLKYGKVITERGSIGDDEPVVVFRAQDKLTPDLLDTYEHMSIEMGCPPEHIHAIREARRAIQKWQETGCTKIPD